MSLSWFHNLSNKLDSQRLLPSLFSSVAFICSSLRHLLFRLHLVSYPESCLGSVNTSLQLPFPFSSFAEKVPEDRNSYGRTSNVSKNLHYSYPLGSIQKDLTAVKNLDPHNPLEQGMIIIVIMMTLTPSPCHTDRFHRPSPRQQFDLYLPRFAT